MIVKVKTVRQSNFTTQAEVFCGKMLDELTMLVRCYGFHLVELCWPKRFSGNSLIQFLCVPLRSPRSLLCG